jgi:hypothetical protein
MKKLNQIGMLSLHVIVPVIIAVAVVGGIGAYVLTKSHAQVPIADRPATCGSIYRNYVVYASAVGTSSKFVGARDSDSVRNISYMLCKNGYLDVATASSINKSGNGSTTLKSKYAAWQRHLGYSGADADGVPGATSLKKLGLSPNGF